MKFWKYIQLASLFLVVYTAGVDPVFGTTETVTTATNQESESRLDHSEKAALVFEEVSILEITTSQIENKFHGFGAGVPKVSCNYSGHAVSTTLIDTLVHRDKRILIAASIFPFHFFW